MSRQTDLFPPHIMKELEINRGLTPEAIEFYYDEGIDMTKYAFCPHWERLRFLFHMYGITECPDCKKIEEEKQKAI